MLNFTKEFLARVLGVRKTGLKVRFTDVVDGREVNVDPLLTRARPMRLPPFRRVC